MRKQDIPAAMVIIIAAIAILAATALCQDTPINDQIRAETMAAELISLRAENAKLKADLHDILAMVRILDAKVDIALAGTRINGALVRAIRTDVQRETVRMQAINAMFDPRFRIPVILRGCESR